MAEYSYREDDTEKLKKSLTVLIKSPYIKSLLPEISDKPVPDSTPEFSWYFSETTENGKAVIIRKKNVDVLCIEQISTETDPVLYKLDKYPKVVVDESVLKENGIELPRLF